jgi:DNA-binding NtrC family response regulator
MSPRRILIVDDEPDMLQLLKRSLEPDLGCSVLTTTSAREAVKRIAEEPLDLVLADIKMPEMDGLELLEVIKRHRPELTVVMMTGHGSIDTAVTSMKNGAHDFITKPFDHETLVVRLEKALERSELVSENDRLIRECRSEDVSKTWRAPVSPCSGYTKRSAWWPATTLPS